MATEQQLISALRNADKAAKAGDARAAEAARRFAAELKRIRNAPPKTAEELTGTSIDPTEGMTTGQRLAAGFGQAYTAAARGLAQAGARSGGLGPVGLATDLATGGGVSRLMGTSDELAALQAQEAEARQLEAPLLNTGAGMTGAVLGNVSQLVGPGIALRGTGLGSAFIPTTIRGAALQGAAIGAVQPTVEGESAAGNVAAGATLGAAGAAIPKLAGAAVRGTAQVPSTVRRLSPAATRAAQERQAAEALLESAADPAALRASLARPNAPLVPGSQPTTAEVTGDVGLAAVERAMRTLPDYAKRFQQGDIARNQARVEFIQKAFGGASREAEALAKEAVQQAQGPAIREAMRQTGAETMRVIKSVDRVAKSPRFRNSPPAQQALTTVRDLLATPIDDAGRLSAGRSVIQDALSTPKRMSAADYEILTEARRLTISGQRAGLPSDEVLKQVRALKPKSITAQSILSDVSRALRTAEKGKPDVASLYNARKYITGTLMRTADDNTTAALRGIVKGLDEEIDKVAPSYKQYLREYSEGMRQANQIGIGAKLLETGKATPGEFAEVRLTPDRFVQATRDMDEFVRRATGFRRARANRTLTPEQLKAVEAVRRDLARFGMVQNQRAAAGSPTVGYALGAARVQSQMSPIGEAAAGMVPGANLALQFVNAARKQYGEKVGQIIYEALENPSRAAQILATLPPQTRPRVVQQVAPYLRQIQDASSAAAAVGAGAVARPENEPFDAGMVN